MKKLLALVLSVAMACCCAAALAESDLTETKCEDVLYDVTEAAYTRELGGIPAATLTESLNSAEAKVGETVAIVLQANATTGYTVTLAEKPEGLTVADEIYLTSGSAMMGAGGVSLWGVKCDKAGEYTLRLDITAPGGKLAQSLYFYLVVSE